MLLTMQEHCGRRHILEQMQAKSSITVLGAGDPSIKSTLSSSCPLLAWNFQSLQLGDGTSGLASRLLLHIPAW